MLLFHPVLGESSIKHNPRLLQNQKTRGETDRSEQVKCSTDQSKALRQDNRFEAANEGNDGNDSSEAKTQEDLLYWLITNNDRRLSLRSVSSCDKEKK